MESETWLRPHLWRYVLLASVVALVLTGLLAISSFFGPAIWKLGASWWITTLARGAGPFFEPLVGDLKRSPG
jgi:hypothetical protein